MYPHRHIPHRAPMANYLSAEILDYIETHTPTDGTGYGVSQRELSRALGYHPCSMSRPLSELVGGGLLHSHRGAVRGGVRKQLVYSLTESGRKRLRRETRNVPLLSAELPPPPNPFVGRKSELRELWSLSREGGSLVFVEGPAGMGKTTLVARHIRRLWAGRVPFWFTIRPGTSPRTFTTALAHALSSLGSPQLAYYAQLLRAPVGREVADLAGRALAERELIAVIDDAQAASADMRKFLTEFIPTFVRGRHDHLYVLSQAAPFFQPAELPTHHLTVGGLDRASAHDLTDRRGGLADRFEGVYQATLGSPLLLQLAIAAPGVEATEAALPGAILARLPEAELRALTPAALANEPLPATFLAENRALPEDRVERLVQMGVLRKTGEGQVEMLQVVRTAFLNRLLAPEERAAHMVLAQFYGRSHRPEAVRERFLHLVNAEDARAASSLLDRQSRTLLALGYSDAVRNALRHLTLVMPPGAARVRVFRSEALLLRAHSDYSDAIVSLRRAITEPDIEARLRAECLYQIVELQVRLREVEEAERTYEHARRIPNPSRRLQVLTLLAEGRIAEAKGDLPRGQTIFEQAFDLARKWRVGDVALEAVAAWSRLASLGGEREAALQVVEQGLPQARASGRLDIVFNLLLVRARAYAELGKKEQAESEMQLLRTEAESLGYLNQLTYTLSGLAAMAVEGGRWPDAIAYARQASGMAERLGNDLVLGHTLAVLALGQQRHGMLSEAQKAGERAVTVLKRMPPTDSLALARAYLAGIYSELGMRQESETEFQAAIQLASTLGMAWWKEMTEKEFAAQRQRWLQADSPPSASTPPA